MMPSHADRDRRRREPSGRARMLALAAVLAFGVVHAQDTPTPLEPTTEPSEVPEAPEAPEAHGAPDGVESSESPDSPARDADADDGTQPQGPGATSNREDGAPKGPGTREGSSQTDASPKGPGNPSQAAPERSEVPH